MMYWLLLFSLAISLVTIGNCEVLCTVTRNPGGLVTLEGFSKKGLVAGIGEYPWAVAIEVNGRIQCAGALILPQVVLTSAYCSSVLNVTNAAVLAGVWNVSNDNPDYPSQRSAIKSIKTPREFSLGRNLLDSDISILILEDILTLTEYIGTVCLQDPPTFTGQCYTTGWGALNPKENLSQVPKNITLSIVPTDECNKTLRKSHKLPKNFKLSKNVFCAKGRNGRDTCTGDGGSPVVCPASETDDRFILAGLTSWGIGTKCDGEFPGVYTDVSKYIDWINDVVSGEGLDMSEYMIWM